MNTIKPISLLFIFLILLNNSTTALSNNNAAFSFHFFQNNYQNIYKVIAVKDGDTFVVLFNNKQQVVRLAHIDCPEKKQPFGTKAKQFAAQLCFGKNVYLLHENNYDRNKRLIAEVIVVENKLNVNKELVKNGLAWHFKKYSNNTEYATLEIKARKEKTGIWSDENPIAPWVWRKSKKH